MAKKKTQRKRKVLAKRKAVTDVRVPKLGKDIGFLLCAGVKEGGFQGLNDGSYSIELFGNAKGFKKLGTYFLALAELDTSDDSGFHHHFCRVNSLSETKIELTVRKNRTADINGIIEGMTPGNEV